MDFRPLEALGWERAYHTGDLVRADPEGLIYLRPGQGTGGLAAAVGQGRRPGHPTVQSLAAAVTELPGHPGRTASAPGPMRVSRVGTAQYVACGVLQLLAFLASVFLAAAVLVSGFNWVSGSAGWADLYLRSLAFGTGTFVLLCGLPILVKWTLVGRWKPQEITVWSLPYLRFWLVKTLVRADPLALFAGSPVYPLYLRALGAKIGRRVVIFSRTVPVCTDMLTIGDDTVIRRNRRSPAIGPWPASSRPARSASARKR